MKKNNDLDLFGSDFKYKRILQLYTKLLKGEMINKARFSAT